MSWQGIEVVQVVATDRHACIGRHNTLPWHVPDDLKHFKQLTLGGVMIMGRKNYESIGRPLPGRMNIVITRQHGWEARGTYVLHSLETALDLAAEESRDRDQGQLYIIGGGEIFAHSLPFTDRIEMTRLELAVEDGDVFFPDIPASFKRVRRTAHTDVQTAIQMHFETYIRTS